MTRKTPPQLRTLRTPGKSTATMMIISSDVSQTKEFLRSYSYITEKLVSTIYQLSSCGTRVIKFSRAIFFYIPYTDIAAKKVIMPNLILNMENERSTEHIRRTGSLFSCIQVFLIFHRTKLMVTCLESRNGFRLFFFFFCKSLDAYWSFEGLLFPSKTYYRGAATFKMQIAFIIISPQPRRRSSPSNYNCSYVTI